MTSPPTGKVSLITCRFFPQALSDSVIGQGLPGSGAEPALASQLKERESQLAACLQNREENGATMCQEVAKLTAALQEYQAVVRVRIWHEEALKNAGLFYFTAQRALKWCSV